MNVLRALITETSNAAKTSTPIKTDLQLLSLIHKRTAAARDAAQRFAEANRLDLKAQEEAQIAVLEEYANHVKTMSASDIQAVVSSEVSRLRAAGQSVKMGPLLKALFAPGGQLDGKPAARAEVAKIVEQTLATV